MQSSAQDLKSIDAPLAARLAKHPFTAGMPAHEPAVLAENAMRVFYPAGKTIFREGDPARSLERGSQAHPDQLKESLV